MELEYYHYSPEFDVLKNAEAVQDPAAPGAYQPPTPMSVSNESTVAKLALYLYKHGQLFLGWVSWDGVLV